MADAKTELAKLMARRKLEGGEFSYVLKLGGEPIPGKKAAFTKLKELQAEVFAGLKTSCQQAGENDEAFESRLLKVLPSLPFEEEAMEVEGKAGRGGQKREARVQITVDLLPRVVRVEGVEKGATQDQVEAHFGREFEGVEKVEKAKDALAIDKAPKMKKNVFDITFKEEKFAKAFLETPDLKYKDGSLKVQLLAGVIQGKVLRRQLNTAFSHNLRLQACVPMDTGKEDNYLWVYGLGRPTEEELQEYFMGLEAEFEGVVGVKQVLHKQGEGQGRLLGVLVQFETKEKLTTFIQLKEVKYKEHVLKWNLMAEVGRNTELRLKAANYLVDDGPTTAQLSARRLVILRLKDDFSPSVETSLKALFPTAKDVRHCSVDRLTLLTFPTAEAAGAALGNMKETDVFGPINVMLVSEYLKQRQAIIEEEAERIEKNKTKYENIKNSHIIVEGNIITIDDPSPAKAKPVKKVEEKKEVAGKKKENGANDTAAVVSKPVPMNKVSKMRMARGANIFDLFVGVRGFNQFIKNMGKASDMDVCNYFIHNHKDVADVKFINWTDIVFAKFKTVEAAERFCSLAYHMFFGVELTLHDVPQFLQKKAEKQQEDVTRVLLGKKFNKSMIEGGEGPAKVAATNGASVEVELLGFSSREAGKEIRDLFIENLHLDQEVVGQPKWMKTGDDFKARLSIKLEADAIGYLVKKWNDLEIAVEGETVVKAEVTGGAEAKEAGAGAKRGRKRPNRNQGTKRPKISLEDY